MTDHDAELEQIARAANELVPELTERLRRSGLGELEVRSGTLRVRVAVSLDGEPAGAGRPEGRRHQRGKRQPVEPEP